MKKILLLLLIFSIQNGFAQKQLTDAQKVAATCKIWGFLKYYHPEVANGKLNWDEKLFNILPLVEKAKKQKDFSEVIEKWIVSLGEVKVNNHKIEGQNLDYFNKNLDLSWLQNNKLYSKSLSDKLKSIKDNRFQGKQFYFTNDPYLAITAEIKYPDFKWTDKNLRLLTLFRYWNVIEYFFPYKYKMDQKWDQTLEEILPRFISPESELDFHLAMKELTVMLNDTHASFGTNKMFDRFGDKFVPFSIKIIDEKAVVTAILNDSLAKKNDILIGDAISGVDKKSISSLIKENSKYVEGSNISSKMRNIYWAIFNGNSDTVSIEYSRGGKTNTKTINRYAYQALKVKYIKKEKWKNIKDNIGYVNIEQIDSVDVSLLMKQFKDAKAIIFDARYYPKTASIEFQISDYLNPEPKECVKFIDPDLSFPSRYMWRKTQTCGKKNLDFYKGKVIILVNEQTQSHGEHTVMCLQTAPQATVIGSQTAGADGGVVQYEIIKGFRTQFTGFGTFYPDGKETQRIGIVPNIEVKPTILGIQQGKDEILDRAIQFIEMGK
jgi:C-terminal processing protease CtpA/Prc